MTSWRIIEGDCRDALRTLEPGSVQTCVTSPPYFGLRAYTDDDAREIGREPTPDEFVAALVGVFREVRRVLRDDGTVWLNLGDSYAQYDGQGNLDEPREPGLHGSFRVSANLSTVAENRGPGRHSLPPGLKRKDLVGIPWMVAFALRQPWEEVVIRDPIDRAWLAAMVDGEGCITTSIAKPTTGVNESYAIVLQVRMADRQCLDRIVEITGLSKVQAETHSPSMIAAGQRPAFAWKIAGDKAAAILAEVYPYLRIKRGQAVAAWNLQRLKDGVVTKRGVPVPAANMEQRRELHRTIRALNQRQEIDVPGWCREPEFHTEPGWYLRSDVIWAKPNPMPESVRDRPTKAHEYVFLLSKGPRYYWDADAIREAPTENPGGAAFYRAKGEPMPDYDKRDAPEKMSGGHAGFLRPTEPGRNKRSVWTVATQPFPGAHFATFPPKLIEPCILAGSPVGGTVLDPFAGAGTTGMVALRHDRSFIGCELSPDYVRLARDRIIADSPLLNTHAEAA